jgi:hypothetical protein
MTRTTKSLSTCGAPWFFSFSPSALQACFGHKIKNPSFASLRGDFVEVGGGFERLILLKPLSLLQNSLKRSNSAFKRITTVNLDKLNNRTIFLFLSPNMSPIFINQLSLV